MPSTDRAATWAMVSPADPHRQRVGIEPGAAAVAAGLRQLVLPEEHPDVLLVPLLLEVLQEGEDPDVAALAAVEQLAAVGRLQLAPRLAAIGAETARELEQDPPAALVARLGPGVDRPLGEAALRVGDDQRLVVLQHRAEAVAGGAGAPRVVEGEERRGDHGGRRVAAAARGPAGEPEPSAVVERQRDALALLEGDGDRLARSAPAPPACSRVGPRRPAARGPW